VPTQIPIVNYLELSDPPHLVASRCEKCEALYFDRRNACAKCGEQEFHPHPLSTRGVVKAFTVVHRAAKSIPTPYMSAVIALDGGGSVKANVQVADPATVTKDLRVQLVTSVVGTDDDGVEAVAFSFKPEESAEVGA
jgi:Predicted nucleic-acid-binding protein containing a Zn-ribbon